MEELKVLRLAVLRQLLRADLNADKELRVLDSILAANNPEKLLDISSLLGQIQREKDTVKVLRDELESCEHCPAVGGGCIVCS